MNSSIDRTLISGLVIITLVGGLVFSPIFTGHKAEALQPTCSPITKHVLLIANETVVQIAPANPLWSRRSEGYGQTMADGIMQ